MDWWTRDVRWSKDRRVPQAENEKTASGNAAAPEGAEQWLGTGRFGIVLGLLIFAAFPQVLLGIQTFVVRDYGCFAYPLAHLQRECFWRGEVPLWNPYNNCGVPFLAQWNTMPLYPPALIYLILPLTWSLSFFCLLHLFSAGMGMYFLARRWTGSCVGAALAGLIFAFNGMSLNLLMWPSHIATLSWMPWVVLAVQNCWHKGERAIVPAVLAGGLQMLAGGPETILLTWLFLVALWFVEWTGGTHASGGLLPDANRAVESSMPAGSPSALKAALRFAAVVLLVAGVAAAQVLPFLDLAAHSERGTGYADTRWSMPASGLGNFLVPMLHGRVQNMGVFFQHDQNWTSSYYLGVGAVVLVLLAVWTVRDRRLWLLTGAVIGSLAMALGDHSVVYRAVRGVFPQISMVTYPVKFLLVAVFCVPLLAGFGVARMELATSDQGKALRKKLVIEGLVLLALMAGILFCAWRFPHPADDASQAVRNGASRAIFVVVTVGLLFSFQRNLGKNSSKLFSVLLMAAFWLDIHTHEPSQNPTVPTWVYTPGMARTKLAMSPQPALGESRAMVSPVAEATFMHFASGDAKDNFLVNRLAYFADCNVLDGVPKVNGFFSLYPEACGDLISTLYASTNADFSRLADFMGVSQITAPGQFFEWTNRTSFLPLITGGQRPVFADGTNAMFSLFAKEFDPRTYVVLPTKAKGLVKVTNRADCRITPVRFSAETIEVEAEAGQPYFVVISQTYYHCWHAYLDGQRTEIMRANHAFQAVEVPPGSHRLKVVYEDRAFRWGLIISAVSIMACVGVWVLGRKSESGSLKPLAG